MMRAAVLASLGLLALPGVFGCREAAAPVDAGPAPVLTQCLRGELETGGAYVLCPRAPGRGALRVALEQAPVTSESMLAAMRRHDLDAVALGAISPASARTVSPFDAIDRALGRAAGAPGDDPAWGPEVPQELRAGAGWRGDAADGTGIE